MEGLSVQSCTPTNLGHVDEEMITPGTGGYHTAYVRLILGRSQVNEIPLRDGHTLPRVPMTDICHYAHEGIEPQLQLDLDPPSLKIPEGWYQGQPYVEGFTNVVFIRGNQPFVSRLRHVKGGNACSGHWTRDQWLAVLFTNESRQCLCLDERTYIQFFSRGNVNVHTYRDDILDAYVRPCAWAIGDAFVRQDDNKEKTHCRCLS
ncbi:DDE_3 domain-containing protein [Trichonephila clavipes]|nr:DDE_3 domain-containing protein [Trichonephila clavipes]